MPDGPCLSLANQDPRGKQQGQTWITLQFMIRHNESPPGPYLQQRQRGGTARKALQATVRLLQPYLSREECIGIAPIRRICTGLTQSQPDSSMTSSTCAVECGLTDSVFISLHLLPSICSCQGLNTPCYHSSASECTCLSLASHHIYCTRAEGFANVRFTHIS